MTLHIVGVRHHSPACARLVRHVIATIRPAHVLVEGPSDMNERIDELLLEHTPPFAVFSYHRERERTQASYSPFCAYSPELVALRAGQEICARVRFMDLPAWDKAFEGRANRYADRPVARRDLVAHLLDKLAIDDMDSLWDHLFEQPLPVSALRVRLEAYFLALRGDEPAGDRDGPREAFMRRAIASALGEGGPVVAVCGGWHAPALAGVVAAPEPFPAAPSPDGASGSYLVPYSFKRLDAFAGYESGMPSPAWYQALWESGPAGAHDTMARAIVGRLRSRKQPFATADFIASETTAAALARLRGHATVARTDLLDGIAAAVVKDGLDVPLPWTVRGTLLPRTEPVLVEVIAALSGDQVGRLDPGTPRPPLLAATIAELEQHDLSPVASVRDVRLSLTDPRGLARSRVLHRLRVLAIPGFERVAGPSVATDGTLDELWRISRDFHFEAALIESSAYGATLGAAAVGRLEEALHDAGGTIERLSHLLAEAVFVGIEELSERLIGQVAGQVQTESSFVKLGPAMGTLFGVLRHDVLFEARNSSALARIVDAAFDRCLWLVEGIAGGTSAADDAIVAGICAIRDVSRDAAPPLRPDRTSATAVMWRRASDAGAPPAVRGAALGYLWSLASVASVGATANQVRDAALAVARPDELGDFLLGLFALAREAAARVDGLIAVIDEMVVRLLDDDFLGALPSLRGAFSYLPPREREGVAERVLARHGRASQRASTLLRLEVSPRDLARGAALDARVEERLRAFGLVPS